jgi:hypothetical protein
MTTFERLCESLAENDRLRRDLRNAHSRAKHAQASRDVWKERCLSAEWQLGMRPHLKRPVAA